MNADMHIRAKEYMVEHVGMANKLTAAEVDWITNHLRTFAEREIARLASEPEKPQEAPGA